MDFFSNNPIQAFQGFSLCRSLKKQVRFCWHFSSLEENLTYVGYTIVPAQDLLTIR